MDGKSRLPRRESAFNDFRADFLGNAIKDS